ncbi:hypothetical protein AB0P15_02235 [Streptomyces sp. NPDC087917]|uniref:hypothetical protein n=1 Tax=Streptomyces sp. NPDC087917 TaxID=3155060 RepID=UPI0034307D6B
MDRTVRGTTAAALPVAAAAAVYGWSHWCFAGATAPSTAVAVPIGAVLIAGATTACFRLVGGNAGFFGALLLALGLLTTVAVADRVAVRGEVADCAVVEVHGKPQASFGEGGPPTRTVYRHVLRCPGGYPSELKDDHRLAAPGGRLRVAYDPDRRVSPEVEGARSPWAPLLLALALLGAATALAARRPPPEPGPPSR